MTHTETVHLSRSLRAGILALMCGFTAAAQTLAPAVPDVGSIRTTMASIQADAGLPEEVKAAALQYYDRAITAVEDRDQRATKLEELNRIIASAPDTLPTLQDRLSASRTAEKAEVPPLTTDDRLQALIADARSELATVRNALEQKNTIYRNTLQGGEDFGRAVWSRWNGGLPTSTTACWPRRGTSWTPKHRRGEWSFIWR